MKTVVLSFENRTSNNNLTYLSKFISFLNSYTLYVDKVVILSESDDNGLIEVLLSTYDILFIINGDNADFYLPSVLAKTNIVLDAQGFGKLNGVVSIVPYNYEKNYPKHLENCLSTKFNVSFEKLTFKLYGISLDDVAQICANINLPKGVYFRFCDTCGDIKVNLIYSDTAPKKYVDATIRNFINLAKNHIYAEDDISLSQRFNDILKLRKQTVCTAESMTGGNVAANIIKTSGASDIYYEGLVTYQTIAKERRLNVKHSTVNQYTVVSEQVCYEMAKGLISQGNCTLAITITGYAGSDIHPSKEDGLCYIGIGTKDNISVYKYHFEGTREENITNATNAALFLAIKTIENLDTFNCSLTNRKGTLDDNKN